MCCSSSTFTEKCQSPGKHYRGVENIASEVRQPIRAKHCRVTVTFKEHQIPYRIPPPPFSVSILGQIPLYNVQ